MFSNIRAARLLGWTSIAVGITEIAATNWLQDELGVDDQDTVIRSFGLREILAGVIILNQPGLNKTLAAGLWARVAGDAMDLAALGKAAEQSRNPKGLASITAVVVMITGLDVLIASLTQRDLHRAATVSTAARKRVHQVSATPPTRQRNKQPNSPAIASA
jgi:hypothetical protein